MTIDNYNEYRTYHSQLMELVFLYFKDVICKEDINEDLVFKDVWFQPDRVIILYENVETEMKYRTSILIDKLLENMNENKFGTVKEPLKSKSNAVKLADGKVIDNLDEEKIMGKKLAIKGHPTRGNEVIDLLEMMGGNDSIAFRCNNPNLIYYVLDNHTRWDYIGPEEIDEYNIFTLEDFLEKFPFKVGDFVRIPEYESEVRILKMKWCPLSEHIEYLVYPNDEEEWFTADELLEDNDNPNKTRDCKKCGLHFGSVRCFDKDCPHNTPKSYAVSLVGDKVIDNLTHKDIDMNTCKDITSDVHKKIAYLSINNEDYADQIEINLGDNYEYKFEMNRLYIVKKKPKYPTTYDEGNTELHFIYVDKDESDLYESFIQLIRCRNAYWKIAGEQMGLDEPWKHNYLKDANTIRYAIYNTGDEIVKLDGKLYRNYILCFPTEEMRDAFFKNFKKEIEQCKELL